MSECIRAESEEKIRSLMKSDEEVDRFILEQKKYLQECIAIDYEGIYEYNEPFSHVIIADWLGKDFMKATELKQHSFMLESEMPVRERVYSYYPKLWKELVKHDEEETIQYRNGFKNNDLVLRRMDFINKYEPNKCRWLKFLYDQKMSKDQWAINFGKNATRQYTILMMQQYQTYSEFTPRHIPEPNGRINVIDRERYRNVCHATAMEWMNENYIYSRNMAKGGYEPGEP
jgi:hypothetical protein